MAAPSFCASRGFATRAPVHSPYWIWRKRETARSLIYLFLFFLFLLYLMFILGRIDGSHFLVYIKNDPTLPLNSQKTGPMAVGGRGGKRHATPSRRPIWHFVFLWPPKQQSPLFNWLFSHRHPNNNQLHWTTENLSFEREEIWNFSLTCILSFAINVIWCCMKDLFLGMS